MKVSLVMSLLNSRLLTVSYCPQSTWVISRHLKSFGKPYSESEMFTSADKVSIMTVTPTKLARNYVFSKSEILKKLSVKFIISYKKINVCCVTSVLPYSGS